MQAVNPDCNKITKALSLSQFMKRGSDDAKSKHDGL